MQIPDTLRAALLSHAQVSEAADTFRLDPFADFVPLTVPIDRLSPRDRAAVAEWAARHHGQTPATVTRYRVHPRLRHPTLDL